MSAVGFESHAAVSLLIYWKNTKKNKACAPSTAFALTGASLSYLQVRREVQPDDKLPSQCIKQPVTLTFTPNLGWKWPIHLSSKRMSLDGGWKPVWRTQARVESADPTQRKPQDWQKNLLSTIQINWKMEREMCFDTFVQISKCSSRVLKWHPQRQTLLMAYPICGKKKGQIRWFLPKKQTYNYNKSHSMMTTETKKLFSSFSFYVLGLYSSNWWGAISFAAFGQVGPE